MLPSPCSLFLRSIGGESLAVAQNTYAVNWFKGKELNLVFGLQLSMARLVRSLPMEKEIHILSKNCSHHKGAFKPKVHSLSYLYLPQGQHSEHEHHGLGVQQNRSPRRWSWIHCSRHITHDRYVLHTQALAGWEFALPFDKC